MKIKKLTLENITCFEKIEFNLNHLTIITGKNKSGKTTIVDSLKKLFTGKIKLIPGGRDRNLLRDEAKTGNIIAEIDDFTLNRGLAARSQSLEISSFSGTATDVQTQFLNRYKLDPDKILATLNPVSFLELDAAKKQSILASLLNLNFDLNYLVQMVKDEKIAEWLKSVGWGNSRGLELLDAIYSSAYQKRRDANRDVKTLNTTIPKIEFPESLEQLQAQKSSLTQEQTFYYTSLSETERRKKSVEALEKEQEAIAKLEPTIPKTKGNVEQIKYDLELLETEIKQLSSQNQALSKIESEPIQTCPIFEIGCPLPAQTIRDKADEKKAALKGIEKQLSEKQKEADKLNKKLEKFENKQLIQKIISQHRQNIEEFQAIINETENLPGSRPLEEIQKELEVVNRKIAELQAAEKYKETLEAFQKAQTDSQFYDTVVNAFDPKIGLKAVLLKKKIGKLTISVNQALKVMSDGYSVDIVFEPETQIRTMALGKTLPSDSLSYSEKMMLGIAFQYAFSILSGTKILVIDQADIFDYENRNKLSAFLTSIREYFDSIILLYTHNTDTPVAPPTQPWITVYYLDGGKCQEVKAERKTA